MYSCISLGRETGCLHMNERCLWPSARSCRGPREDLIKQFRVLKKCNNEIVIHKTFKTQPNVQSDAIRANVLRTVPLVPLHLFY